MVNTEKDVEKSFVSKVFLQKKKPYRTNIFVDCKLYTHYIYMYIYLININ